MLSKTIEIIEKIKEIEKDCLNHALFKEAIANLAEELYEEDILEEIKEEEKYNHLAANFADIKWQELKDWRLKLKTIVKEISEHLEEDEEYWRED